MPSTTLQAGRAVGVWLGHIKALAGEIGPRGSATPEERRGSEHCASILAGLGYRPVTENFFSSGSVFLPHLVAALGMLLSFVLYPLAPPVTSAIAAGLAALAVLSELLELGLRDNPLRWVLPKRQSQNVHAVMEPAGRAERDVVLMGHVDTQRTPVIFSSQGWLDAYKILSGAAFVSFLAQAILYSIGAWTGWGWVWPASAVAAVFALLLAALVVHAERTPHTPGANDNSSGVGLVLTMAEALKGVPLSHIRVWLVCTGCEEALHEGARHFFAEHRREMTEPRTINLEMLGCAGPAWLVREGIVTPLHPSPELRRLAEEVAAANEDLGAYPVRLSGGVTEASDSINAGIPALTLMGADRENHVPYWHLMEDTPDKMRPEIMGRVYEFLLKMLLKLDG